MTPKLKPLNQQVIFVTGATSSIGLATVRLATEEGARVFMTGLNEDELQKIQDEMRWKDCATAYAVADITDMEQIEVAADHCLATFGTIDTWVNVAQMSISRKVPETSQEEGRRIFELNFWGLVNCCQVAEGLLKEKGGAIINIESLLHEMNFSVRGIHSASKHAVKGYTEALRKEFKSKKIPVSLTLIEPGTLEGLRPLKVARLILKSAHKKIKEADATKITLRRKTPLFFRRLKRRFLRGIKSQDSGKVLQFPLIYNQERKNESWFRRRIKHGGEVFTSLKKKRFS